MPQAELYAKNAFATARRLPLDRLRCTNRTMGTPKAGNVAITKISRELTVTPCLKVRTWPLGIVELANLRLILSSENAILGD